MCFVVDRPTRGGVEAPGFPLLSPAGGLLGHVKMRQIQASFLKSLEKARIRSKDYCLALVVFAEKSGFYYGKMS